MRVDTLAAIKQFMPVLPTVTIEPLEGQTGSGEPSFGSPVSVEVVIDQTRRRVLNAEGSEVISESTLVCAAGTACPDGSRVTLPDGHVTYSIITKTARDHGQDDLPAHTEIALQ